MPKKREWIKQDAFLIFYLKSNHEPDVVYHNGSGRAVIKSKTMADYDLAVTINVSHVIDPINKLAQNAFTRREVAEQIGLSDRLVKFYTDEDLIIPEINPGRGRGHVRRYSKKNLIEFALINKMLSLNMKIKKMEVFLKEFLDWFRTPAHGIFDRYTGSTFKQSK